MKTEMTKPCSQCPFLTTCASGWLGRSRAKEIADALLADRSFSCHKTVEYGDEEADVMPPKGEEEQHCAGAMIFLEKQKPPKPNQWMRWMERLGFYDHAKVDMTAKVFASARAFVTHHGSRRERR